MGVESLILFVISLVISVFNQLAMKASAPPSAQATATQEARGHQQNVKSNQAPVAVIYGETRIGGTIVYENSSSTSPRPSEQDNKYYHMVMVLGEGEIEGFTQVGGVDEVYLDAKLYTEYGGNVYYEVFKGTADQNVCATLQAACPEWNDPLRYTAYLYIRLTYNEDYFTQRPDVTVGLKGLKVYDPDPGVEDIVYSDNPALHTYDIATRSTKRGGMGIHTARFDMDSVIEARSYCIAKGWICGIPLTEKTEVMQDISDLLMTFRGTLIDAAGTFKLKYRDLNYEAPVMALDEGDVLEQAGKSSLKIHQPNIFNSANTVRCKFYDKEQKYVKNDLVLPYPDAVASDGESREQEIQLLGINDYQQVGKMATYHLEKLIINKGVSFQASPRCLALEPFDAVTLTHSKPGWTDKILRVTAASWNNAGFANLTLEEEDEIFYDDVFDVEAHSFHDTNAASPLDPVPSVIGVSITEELYTYRDRSFTRLKVNFSPPDLSDYPYWSYANIYCKIGEAGDWKFMTKAVSSYEIDPVQEGVNYFIKIQSVSIWGTKEDIDNSYTVSKRVLGKVDLPTSLSALSAIANGDTVTLMAIGVADSDIAGYEFRLGTSWGQGVFIGFTLHPSLRLVGVRPGTFNFVANVKDNAGNYGDTPRSASCTVFYPAGYIDKNTWDWDFTVGSPVEQYPPEQDGDHVKATTFFNSRYAPYDATDPAKSLFGAALENAWMSRPGTTVAYLADGTYLADSSIIAGCN